MTFLFVVGGMEAAERKALRGLHPPVPTKMKCHSEPGCRNGSEGMAGEESQLIRKKNPRQ